MPFIERPVHIFIVLSYFFFDQRFLSSLFLCVAIGSSGPTQGSNGLTEVSSGPTQGSTQEDQKQPGGISIFTWLTIMIAIMIVALILTLLIVVVTLIVCVHKRKLRRSKTTFPCSSNIVSLQNESRLRKESTHINQVLG